MKLNENQSNRGVRRNPSFCVRLKRSIAKKIWKKHVVFYKGIDYNGSRNQLNVSLRRAQIYQRFYSGSVSGLVNNFIRFFTGLYSGFIRSINMGLITLNLP
ncbi:hypothetical protein SAMN05421868_101265 [Paenibacillus naphthalenovorans]|nr:hypothetical protein SAMN05421868_101265 [Paenibacillus naphthalenovorans]